MGRRPLILFALASSVTLGVGCARVAGTGAGGDGADQSDTIVVDLPNDPVDAQTDANDARTDPDTAPDSPDSSDVRVEPPPMTGLVGAPCTLNSQCGPYGAIDPVCLPETLTAGTCIGYPSGAPNGMCVAVCPGDGLGGTIDCCSAGGCPFGTTCVNLDPVGVFLVCLPDCTPSPIGNGVCRDETSPTTGSYGCFALTPGPGGVCYAGCVSGGSTGTCDYLHCATGVCTNSVCQ